MLSMTYDLYLTLHSSGTADILLVQDQTTIVASQHFANPNVGLSLSAHPAAVSSFTEQHAQAFKDGGENRRISFDTDSPIETEELNKVIGTLNAEQLMLEAYDWVERVIVPDYDKPSLTAENGSITLTAESRRINRHTAPARAPSGRPKSTPKRLQDLWF